MIIGIIIGTGANFGIMKFLQWMNERSLIVQNFKLLPLYRLQHSCIYDKLGRRYRLLGLNVNGASVECMDTSFTRRMSWGKFIKVFPEHTHEVLMLGSATYANKYKSEQEFNKILNEVEKELG